MKRIWNLLNVAIVLGLLLSLVGFTSPVSGEDALGKNIASDRLLVRFKAGTPWNDMAEVHQRVGGMVDAIIPRIGVHVVTVPRGQGLSKSAAYRLDNEVLYVEPDGVAQTVDLPNDPYFNSQWGMTKVQAPQAWDITQGSPRISIAILDTGIDMDHPDLAGKVVDSINFSDSPTPGFNGHNHGTHVAGIAAATTSNGIGVAGLGRDCSLMNVKVLSDSGYGYYSWVAEGIIWAADNGADVINLSLGGSSPSATLEDAVDYAWSKGVVVVAAAGNSGSSSAFYPAYYANCVAVGATDSNDNLASFSNHGSWVDVAAPGASTYSTLPDGQYGYKSGTSMANPHVAGLSGLVLCVATDANGNGRLNDEVRSIIEATCDDVGIDVAYGRINAYQAVQGFQPQPTGQIVGVVTDAITGNTISGATVSDGMRSAATDSSGDYCITEVAEGSHTVTASADGYQSSSKDATVTAGETTVSDFGLSPVKHPPTLDPIGDKTVDEGQLLQFAISALDPDGDSLNYSASNLPTGASFYPDSHTFAWNPSYGQAGSYPNVSFTVSDGMLSDSEEITVTVNEVVLTGQIAGIVTDAITGNAISGAKVSDGMRSATTGSSGDYCITEVAEGSHTVTASALGYEASSQSDVRVYPGNTATANFSLTEEPPSPNIMWVESVVFTPSGKHLSITVKVVNQEPVKKAEVTLELTKDGTLLAEFSGLANPAGEVTFRWRHAANGDYLATVTMLTHKLYVWDKSKDAIPGTYTLSR